MSRVTDMLRETSPFGGSRFYVERWVDRELPRPAVSRLPDILRASDRPIDAFDASLAPAQAA